MNDKEKLIKIIEVLREQQGLNYFQAIIRMQYFIPAMLMAIEGMEDGTLFSFAAASITNFTYYLIIIVIFELIFLLHRIINEARTVIDSRIQKGLYVGSQGMGTWAISTTNCDTRLGQSIGHFGFGKAISRKLWVGDWERREWIRIIGILFIPLFTLVLLTRKYELNVTEVISSLFIFFMIPMFVLIPLTRSIEVISYAKYILLKLEEFEEE
ncbi:MAG: hypothetical protein OR994_07985 [Candidatus Poseidoniales archaeon]|nr:hypothetical protein [Candidatus Poseidoniales archaeon]